MNEKIKIIYLGDTLQTSKGDFKYFIESLNHSKFKNLSLSYVGKIPFQNETFELSQVVRLTEMLCYGETLSSVSNALFVVIDSKAELCRGLPNIKSVFT